MRLTTALILSIFPSLFQVHRNIYYFSQSLLVCFFILLKRVFASVVNTVMTRTRFCCYALVLAPLVLCCDRFDRGSGQVKSDLVDLVTEDYDITPLWI